MLGAACVGAPLPDAGALGGAGSGLALPAASSPNAGDERDWRTALAEDEDPTEAALALLAQLEQQERLPDALVVLDAAELRCRDPFALQVARAGVLRDLGRRQESRAALHGVRMRWPARFGPGLALECAELSLLLGDLDGAQRECEALAGSQAGAAFLAQDPEAAARLEAALSRGSLTSLRARDLLADLRTCEDAARRRAAFALLRRAGGPLLQRGVILAVADSDPGLRAVAVAAAQPDPDAVSAFLRLALDDSSAAVRKAAALRLGELPNHDGASLAVVAIAKEQDPEIFWLLHSAAAAGTGPAPSCERSRLSDANYRREVAARWQEQGAP